MYAPDDRPESRRRSAWKQAYFFALGCVAIFLTVLFSSQVRFRTPEPLRLRYCSLQTGERYGPLSSSWADFEWEKIFDWEAGDTEYRPPSGGTTD